MKVPAFIKLRPWARLVIGLTLAGGAAMFVAAGTTSPIDSYAACLEAGNPVLETDPPICRDSPHNFTGTLAPRPPTAPPVTSVPFEILVDADTHSAAPSHSQEFIDSQAGWEHYWRAVHAGLPALPPLIPVDFTTSSVVAVSLGQQTTTGFGLKITNINAATTGTVVNLTESTPTITCTVAQALTNRYLIVRTPKLARPISFHITSEKRRCS